MKAVGQSFPVVLFIMLVLALVSVDEILKCDHWNEGYIAVLSCGAVYCVLKLVLTFASVGEILKCNDSNESYRAVLSLSYSRAVTLH